MEKSRKVIFAFAGIFVAGAICGCLVGMRVGRHLFPSSSRTALSDNFGPQMMKRLEDQLALTPEQAAQIGPIVQRTQGEVQRLRKEHVRDITATMSQMHSEISALLTPDQRVKLEEMRKRFLERSERLRREFRGGDRPPPPPS